MVFCVSSKNYLIFAWFCAISIETLQKVHTNFPWMHIRKLPKLKRSWNFPWNFPLSCPRSIHRPISEISWISNITLRDISSHNLMNIELRTRHNRCQDDGFSFCWKNVHVCLSINDNLLNFQFKPKYRLSLSSLQILRCLQYFGNRYDMNAITHGIIFVNFPYHVK